ncbi:MAG: sugar transporter permease [Haloplasmataceae bacterium]|jgi:multiple sugar transport system permease protein|nr:sugar transporter permease [Haloplasmataceae bacterium]
MGDKVIGKNKKQDSLSGLLKRQSRIAYLFILPVIIFFTIFTIIPLVMSLVLSFTDYNMVNKMDFVGLENFIHALKDKYFIGSIKNVLLYTIMFVPIAIFSSLLVASLLDNDLRGKKFFRAIYYLPALTSSVATAFIWQWLMNPSYGLINQILNTIGIKGVEWLNSPKTALFSIVIISVWGSLGGNMLIYLAALRGIPSNIYEACKMDGANFFQKLVFITIPLLRPTTYFILTMSLIGSFQLFDIVYLLTGGGPVGSTTTPVHQIYMNAFGEFKGGLGSAMSVILFFIIMTITLLTQKLVKENY